MFQNTTYQIYTFPNIKKVPKIHFPNVNKGHSDMQISEVNTYICAISCLSKRENEGPSTAPYQRE